MAEPHRSQSPRVTIGMPVYNSRAPEFRAAFESILAQDYADFEVLISDNGSDDASRAMYESAAASDSRVRLVRHAENYGAIFNFSYVLDHARGEFFLWAADDDLRAETYLRKTVALLDRHPEAVTAGTRVVNVDASGARIGEVEFNPNFCLPRPSQRIPVRGCCATDFMDIYSLHRRSALLKIHPGQLMHGADVLLVRELLILGKIVRVDEDLFFYRVPTSYSVGDLPMRLAGSADRELPFRQPVVYLALRLLLAAATLDADITPRERAACISVLLSSLSYYGWLTPDLRMLVRNALPESIVKLGWRVAR